MPGSQPAFNSSHVIMAKGLNAELNKRRDLIEKTLIAWKKSVHPGYLRAMLTYLQEVTKVEMKEGLSKGGKMTCKIRLPSDLFFSLQRVFNKFHPDGDPFAASDIDLKILLEVAPKLMPAGLRKHRGKRA